jgi:hypothetical protein
VAEAIPGHARLNERSLITKAGMSPLAPERAIQCLEAAGKRAVGKPTIRNPRAWALQVLTNVEFAEDVLRNVRPDTSGEIAPGDSGAPPVLADPVVAPVAEVLAQEGLRPGGASDAARSVVAAGVALDTLPFLLGVLRETVETRSRQDRVRNREGFLVHLLRNLDKQTLAIARSRQEAARERWQAVASMEPRIGSPLAGFRAFPGAMDALGAFALAQERLLAAGSDAPGYFDLFDAKNRAQNAVVGAAKLFLGEEVIRGVEAEVHGRLQGGGLAPGTLVWDRAWKHYLGGAILDRVGIRQC